MKKEILINFDEVKQHINLTCKWTSYRQFTVTPIIDATEQFAMDYIKYPYGFAETDNLNDIGKLLKDLDDAFWGILADDGRSVKSNIKRAVNREVNRWKDGNASYFGRMIGRLAYLLNEEKKKYAN
jgi:hypothetical protein